MYTPEQQAIIDAALEEAAHQQQNTQGWVTYDWSDLMHQRGADTFAIFGDTAYLLGLPERIEDTDAAFEYRPVIRDGQMFREWPDEGGARLLYLCRCVRRGKNPVERPWVCLFVAARWLHTHELDLTNDEIAEDIGRDIERGENVLTRKPPGWA